MPIGRWYFAINMLRLTALALARILEQEHKSRAQEIGFRAVQCSAARLFLFNHLAKAGFDLRLLFQLQ